MAISYNTSIIKDGLVLYLDAANPKSYPGTGTTWFDLSGNGNNVTLFNGVTYDSNTKSLVFDGINDYARTINTLDLSPYNSVTIEVCFKDNNPLKDGMIFEHSSNWNSNTSGFGLVVNSNGNTYFNNLHHTNHRLASGAVNYSGYSGNNVVVHTNIFSRVIDSTGRVSYINKENRPLVTGSSTTGSYAAFRNDNFFISSRGGASIFTNCNMFYIKIYGRKISAQENTKNFEATRGRYGI
jgi:hypothetical protein